MERVEAPPIWLRAPKKAYERPRIVWREPYRPQALGASCGKSSDPRCVPKKA